MRQQLIASIVLFGFTCGVLLIKIIYFKIITKEEAFYFYLLFWTGGLLSVILASNVLWQRFGRRPEVVRKQPVHFTWPNRRQSFRLVYPISHRPLIVIERTGDQPLRHLEYPVVDISEGGICFLDDGTSGAVEDFSGRLVFKQGKNMRIAGTIVRRVGERISVQLHRNIAWQTILKEQRRLMSKLK